MLTFFRRMRKGLIGPGQAQKYILYAIGEIALVVIGILIALQINNWNQNRLLKAEEISTLKSLQIELLNNEEIIKSCRLGIQDDIRVGDSIRMHIGPDKTNISEHRLNWWLGNTGETQRCQVITDALEELRSTGNLKIITNIKLRRKIGQWSSALNDLRKEEDDWALEFSQQYIPYTSKWIAWDDIDYLFNKNDPRYFESRFEYDSRLMLNEFEFGNQFAMHYWRMSRIELRINQLSGITNDLVQLIDDELNKL
ncbi:MAG: DUF6090 family protein [Melioribacteraceae bacterium]|nr:DUF6090 family protein [Melioribacteraceae bacterium]